MGPPIWCLFSVDNNYDQPPNNLVAFWHEKPSLDALAERLTGCTIQALSQRGADATIIAVVGIWSGTSENGQLPHSDTAYRLESVAPGETP